ncbi:hypothetical protein NEMBOFW57_001916 [Staphylotrichum longicolle]|uniref:N-acetyltransferase domain-containing protein n=1 Tax=Staphylotrichum longicolle TaxID=669026 RepID=A0AAD4F5A3_9PEZI|nr:hypothetical protein NEMBOFW57_001916 [Staphylotrichum longicolle]
MSRAQQSSIRSFFQPRRQPEYAAPPSAAPPLDSSNIATESTSQTVPPPAPPLPAGPPKPVTIPITLPPNGVPVLPSPPSIPVGATIVPLAEQHIPALRRINSLLLPVPYPDSFYANVLDPLASGLFSRVILWQDSDADTPKVIGGLVCRLEPNRFLDAQGQPLPQPPVSSPRQIPPNAPLDTPYHAIYIQSLALLSPYRSLGLAAAALEHIIASATLLPAAGSTIDARTIYAHVWTENEEGLKWYEARGFAREGSAPIKGYYFKLRPDSAWVVRRHIGPTAAAAAAAAAASASTSNISNGTMAGSSASASASASAGGVLAAAINLPPSFSSTPPRCPPTSTPSATTAPPPPSSTTTSTTTTTTTLPPPPRRPAATPSPAPSAASSSLSFQNTRPESEWNDLPADMVAGSGSGGNQQQQQQQFLVPPNSDSNGNGNGNGNGSGNGRGTPASVGSAASSRSSSTARKRKERTYPSAAFAGSMR